MTCFWDSLRNGLQLNISNNEFINNLKDKNTANNTNILWNNISLTKKQLEENYIHVRDFDIQTINNGYYCSVCDPFIILICDIYNINIHHNYNGYLMKYTHINKYNTILYFNSDKGHFNFQHR